MGTCFPDLKTTLKMKTVAVHIACLAVCQAVKFEDCGSSASYDASSIKITGCEASASKCSFKRGEDAKMEFPFTTKTEVTSMKAVVHGIIAGIPVPFPLPDDDACATTTPACPLAAGTSALYKYGLPVSSVYPKVSVKVKWEIKDQSGNDVICIQFPVQLT